MKKLLAVLLLAMPLLAQTPTPTVTPTFTRTPTVTPTYTFTRTPMLPERYLLARQVRPGFGTYTTESTENKLGDTYYGTGTMGPGASFAKLAGNITTSRNFLCQTGTGSVSAAPAWCLLLAADIPSLDTSKITSGILATARGGNPLTTKGDLPCWSTLLTRLPVGTNTYTLTADSTKTCGFDWAAGSGLTSPLAVKGDVWGFTTVNAACPSGGIGTNGTILTADSTDACGFKWVANSGSTTVGSKGDVQTFSTVAANLPVGTDGQVVMAASGETTGLVYAWPRIGTLRTLKETVFAGITPTGYTNGNTYTIDGSDYTAAVPGGGAIDMVATGLRLRRGTTSGSSAATMTIAAAATNGNFTSIIGEDRFRRNPWAIWIRLASYDFTNTAAGNSWSGLAVQGPYPKWGFQLRSRARNINGTPNTTTGGIALDHWMFGTDVNPSSYPGVSTADVLCALVRDFNTVDVYYGTYSGGWPTIASMTLMGRVAGASGWIGAATSLPSAALTLLVFEFGGAASTSGGTAEVIFDRWRIVTWE